MALTKTQVIAIFRNSYPACSDADCSRHFDEAYQKVLIDLSLRQDSISISLEADEWRYDVDESLKNVYQVRLITDNGSNGRVTGKRLSPVSPELMLAQQRDWELNQGTGEPERYAFISVEDGDSSKLQIWLDPVPDTDGTGGVPVPRIDLDGTKVTPLDGADEIGSDIPDEYIIVARMKARYAREFAPQDYEMGAAEYAQLLNEAKNLIFQRQRLEPPTLQPAFFQGQRRAV